MVIEHSIYVFPSQHPDWTVEVALEGEFDPTTSDELLETFRRTEVSHAPRLRVDLTHVSFLDSSTIHALAVACWTARTAGNAFSVRCGEGMTRRIFDMLDMNEFLGVEAASVSA
jgi:anti-anti-sigma factor